MKKRFFSKQRSLRVGLSLIVMLLLLLHVPGYLPMGFIDRLESYTYDTRLQWTMPSTVDKRVVIVDIDEKSLLEQGQFPWPRNKLAHMVDMLFDHYKIDVLGFDVVFAERDESSGLRSLEALAQGELRNEKSFTQALKRLSGDLQYDQIFADSLKNRKVALGYFFVQSSGKVQATGQLPPPVFEAGMFDVDAVGPAVAAGYTANLPQLQQAATAAGFFNSTPLIDNDGVVRRVSLVQMFDGSMYESLSLAVTRLALDEPFVDLGYAPGDNSVLGLEFLQLGKRLVPIDADMAALVPYRGRQGSFRYVSASDVLNGKADPDVLQGAIVLVGTTAPGLNDLRTTPVQDVYSGVEVHANMITAIIDESIRSRPAFVLGVEAALLLTVGLLLAFVLPLLSPLLATLVTLATFVAVLALNLLFWEVGLFIVPLATSLVLVSTIFVLHMSFGYFVDARGKRLLARLFGQYVPPELVDEMAHDPEAYSLEGSNRDMTVLFSDVRGFTTISEGLDPKQLTQLMNDFLTPMTHVIHHNRGTIDKYMGDAIMAFWGAPLNDPDHARHALNAAMEMIAKLESMQEYFRSRGWPPIKVGVGLNTGEMTVGNMGSEFRLAYTVMGDAVNLGSRLESLTKNYGVQIMVSEFTMARVPEFAFRELDWVRVKGKDKAVKIYEPLGLAEQMSAADRRELADYHAALGLYRNQEWYEAHEAFLELQRNTPHRVLYALYLERIAHFVNEPPESQWDSTFTLLSK